MNAKPFFSVIIPTYNRSDIMKEAIESVLQQTYDDFEIIVIDDHSTDDTEAVVRGLGDDRIIYKKNTRKKGGGGARNEGIFTATGEWVAFLDDDDVWVANKLELFYKKIKESDGETGLIYSAFTYYDFNNKVELKTNAYGKTGWIRNDLLYTNWIGTYSAVAVRTDLLHSINGLDEDFSSYQDLELYVRITEVAKVEYIPESLTLYRVDNLDNISKSFDKKLSGNLKFYSKYKEDIHKLPKVHHRVRSQLFLNALGAKNWRLAIQSVPWTLAGIVLDPKNILITTRTLAKRLSSK
ncbi:glycosyltransferase involved in cell wall biosynthesis [Bacillus tianshenii]|uniref:Glycosyltransferase involved in cell wall biosynthesis n=1 Tax=Sutcliffiella tianshenii TaxID=1463404 RepID=A0ABS2NUY8_9BACI|nr:glycosyltransferase family 2 protein [Bacillus tianshenii]MBM7618238.1 glycosyltransferase involved in cell wall biosynthesis [Bacillus tianshenii]